MLQTLCVERTLCSCIKVRITHFNSDIQPVPAVPSTALTVTLPSSQGAWQLTDLGMGFGTWCTVPIYLGPSAVTSLTGAGPERLLRSLEGSTDNNTGGKQRLQGHLDSGCDGDTPVVLVTTAKGLRKLHLILCLWLKPMAGSSTDTATKCFPKRSKWMWPS